MDYECRQDSYLTDFIADALHKPNSISSAVSCTDVFYPNSPTKTLHL